MIRLDRLFAGSLLKLKKILDKGILIMLIKALKEKKMVLALNRVSGFFGFFYFFSFKAIHPCA
jgi:hypothetical protein